MLLRKTVFALALVGAAVPAAFANSAVTIVGGDRAFEFHDAPSTTTRATVRQKLAEFRQNPQTSDGGTLGGRGGVRYLEPQHGFAIQGGKLVHADQISHAGAKPDALNRNAGAESYGGGRL